MRCGNGASSMNPEQQALDAEASRCVQCGLCVPKCPTYQLTRNEADSPRGRIAIMRAVWSGRLELEGRALAHLDGCLTCRACEAACPSQVRYGQLIDGMRPELAARLNESASVGLLKKIVQQPALFRLAARAGRLARRFGWQAGMLANLPPRSRSFAPGRTYPVSQSPRGEVALFAGCVGSSVDAETVEAAIKILNRIGFTVRVPAAQTCCGAMHLHSGDMVTSAQLLQRNRQAFAADVPVLFLASGCGVQLQEGLPDRDMQDALAFIEQYCDETLELLPLPQRVGVHEPCSQRNVLKTQAAVYALLRKIPSLEVAPLPGNEQCCGAAGSYYLTHPDVAQQLRDGKMQALKQSQPDWVVSSNIGCALWLARGLAAAEIDVVHPLVLLARQLQDE